MTKEKVSAMARKMMAQSVAASLHAERTTRCERKGVSALLVKINRDISGDMEPVVIAAEQNGPVLPAILCGGQEAVGSCGCMHAEIRLILRMLEEDLHRSAPLVIVTTYSPCSQCANAIVRCGDYIKGCCYGYLTEHDKRGLAHIQHYLPCYQFDNLMRPTQSDVSIILEQWI